MKQKHGTGIEWTHWPDRKGETWNPIQATNIATGQVGWGCVRQSPACDFCYAASMNVTRPFGRGTGLDYTHQNLKRVQFSLNPDVLKKPLTWMAPRCIFVVSMSDWMADFAGPLYWNRLMAVAALATQHVFLFLTKRNNTLAAEWGLSRSAFLQQLDVIDAAVHLLQLDGWTGVRRRYYAEQIRDREWPPQNVMLGVTIEDQRRFNERIGCLYEVKLAGWRTFVSYEPALSAIDWDGARLPVWGDPPKIERTEQAQHAIDWLITGAESGKIGEARATHPRWIRDTLAWSKRRGVPGFHKQNGVWIHDTQVPIATFKSSGAGTVFVDGLKGYRDGDSEVWFWNDGSCSHYGPKKRHGALIDRRLVQHLPDFAHEPVTPL